MVAFTYALPAGIPGSANRINAGATIEAQVIAATNPPTFYGQIVMVDPVTGQIRPSVAGDGATPNFYGILVRPYPTHATQDPPWINTPPTAGICDVMKRGYMICHLFGGAQVAKGMPVHVGLAGVAGPNVNGGVTGGAVSSTIALLGDPKTTYFMGAADAQGVVEIAFNL
jgi:hypothetical protein